MASFSICSWQSHLLCLFLLLPSVYAQSSLPDVKLKACANKECSEPISTVVATEDYSPTKPEYLVFYKHEKINVYSHYLTPPFNKLWYGEVVGVKPVVSGLFPKNLVKEVKVYVQQPVQVEEQIPVAQNAKPPAEQEIKHAGAEEEAGNDNPNKFADKVDALPEVDTLPKETSEPTQDTPTDKDSTDSKVQDVLKADDSKDAKEASEQTGTESHDQPSTDPSHDISPTAPKEELNDESLPVQPTPPLNDDKPEVEPKPDNREDGANTEDENVEKQDSLEESKNFNKGDEKPSEDDVKSSDPDVNPETDNSASDGTFVAEKENSEKGDVVNMKTEVMDSTGHEDSDGKSSDVNKEAGMSGSEQGKETKEPTDTNLREDTLSAHEADTEKLNQKIEEDDTSRSVLKDSPDQASEMNQKNPENDSSQFGQEEPEKKSSEFDKEESVEIRSVSEENKHAPEQKSTGEVLDANKAEEQPSDLGQKEPEKEAIEPDQKVPEKEKSEFGQKSDLGQKGLPELDEIELDLEKIDSEQDQGKHLTSSDNVKVEEKDETEKVESKEEESKEDETELASEEMNVELKPTNSVEIAGKQNGEENDFAEAQLGSSLKESDSVGKEAEVNRATESSSDGETDRDQPSQKSLPPDEETNRDNDQKNAYEEIVKQEESEDTKNKIEDPQSIVPDDAEAESNVKVNQNYDHEETQKLESGVKDDKDNEPTNGDVSDQNQDKPNDHDTKKDDSVDPDTTNADMEVQQGDLTDSQTDNVKVTTEDIQDGLESDNSESMQDTNQNAVGNENPLNAEDIGQGSIDLPTPPVEEDSTDEDVQAGIEIGSPLDIQEPTVTEPPVIDEDTNSEIFKDDLDSSAEDFFGDSPDSIDSPEDVAQFHPPTTEAPATTTTVSHTDPELPKETGEEKPIEGSTPPDGGNISELGSSESQLPEKESTQDKSPETHKSLYPRTFDEFGNPIKYVYTEILASMDHGFERQAWVVASQVPDTLQPTLAREPFGYSGADMVKLGIIGLALALTAFLYTVVMAFLVCIDGCMSSSKMKRFAYEALEKSSLAQTQVEELQLKIKDLQNEAIIAQGEAQQAKDGASSVNDEKAELLQKVASLEQEVTSLVQEKTTLEQNIVTVQTQCDQNAGYITEWQAYSKTQQDLYEAELIKSQHYQAELEASKTALAEAEAKLQNTAQLSGTEADELRAKVEQVNTDYTKMEQSLNLQVEEVKRELGEVEEQKSEMENRLEEISNQLREKEEEITQANIDKDEMRNTVELRDSELEILRTCVTELRKAGTQSDDGEDEEQRQQAIDSLMDTAKIQTELDKVIGKAESLQSSLDTATESITQLEEKALISEKTTESLKTELDAVQKEKTNTEGAMAQISKLLAEANLTIGRMKVAAEESKQQQLEDSQATKVIELRAELTEWKDRVAKTEEEYKTNEKDMRKRLLESEKKAHESWLSFREAERKIGSLKQELETMRRSYATLEADYQEGEESYRQLQLQMEAKERDDASIADSKRPHSRSSMRSSRFEEGHRGSLSPFNGSESEPPKPVDPLRAPPPASTYKKGERKKKSKLLKARKEESPLNMADSIEWNESTGSHGDQSGPYNPGWPTDPYYPDPNSMYPQQMNAEGYPIQQQMPFQPQPMPFPQQMAMQPNPQYDMQYMQYQQQSNMVPMSQQTPQQMQNMQHQQNMQQMPTDSNHTQNYVQQNMGQGSPQLPPHQ